MIVVTGGAGFIGSNLVRGLNDAGRSDLVVVDDLTDTRKVRNLASSSFADYLDRDEFMEMIVGNSAELEGISAVLHQGATSSTTDPNGRTTVSNNFTYSKAVLKWCSRRGVPLIYASSAAVYGDSASFDERSENERPLNAYGLSKLMFDNYVRRYPTGSTSQVVGLRYFNVYGPGEEHKDEMSSIVRQLDDQIRSRGCATLFGASHGHGAGEQRRDFVTVQDVVAVVLWFLHNPAISGIYNCGTGTSRTFLDVARVVTSHHRRGEIEFVDFPEELRGRYQAVTEADLSRLRGAGCTIEFASIEDGIDAYLKWRDDQAL